MYSTGGVGGFLCLWYTVYGMSTIYMQCLDKLCTYQCYAPLPLVDGGYMGGLSEDSAPIVGNLI